MITERLLELYVHESDILSAYRRTILSQFEIRWLIGTRCNFLAYQFVNASTGLRVRRVSRHDCSPKQTRLMRRDGIT